MNAFLYPDCTFANFGPDEGVVFENVVDLRRVLINLRQNDRYLRTQEDVHLCNSFDKFVIRTQ
jgi:hypothetical protein